ncbi:hypothetical protein CU311_06805 [Prochlorococcus marinus str. MU1402]|uniref:SGNH/GDSL hydrolase family protein n=1 Tax=Prochlorococcus marinus TaxID=1219 RepID=UPI001AD9A5C9|nr:SGNH/GDSL hydrolase family protein [Prochlorococcus marinus]MBO8232389.1 SGNH/GDSL hydrolase family protein [Prochlorococcus marinus XMU1402]MBW3057116.1 hypothetical protein [Prochlorococcus marinus str. MU1402]
MSITKKITINTLVLVMMLGILETASRIYLSRKDFNGLAIIEFATKVRVYMHSFKYKGNSKKGNRELKCLANAANDYTKKNVLPFYRKYEQGFNTFLKTANNIPVIILYLPSRISGDLHKQFFSNLARKNSLDFIDMSPILRNSGDIDIWSLYPEDGHLSRFGNKIIARKLSSYLLNALNKEERKIDRNIEMIKKQLTFLQASKSSIWNKHSNMVYRVYTNKNGFRTTKELKSDSKIAIVYGDSFTFGPYLANHDTFPELAQKNLIKLGAKNIQILNAGLNGSTIFHEAETLKKTVKIQPNIIILQVLDNDIEGVSYAKMRQIRPVPLSDADLFKPSIEELKILENCD